MSIFIALALGVPQGPPAGNAANGKRVYAAYGCYQCHGRAAQGSSVTGPRLPPRPVPYDAFAAYVRRPAADMPPYSSKILADSQLVDIYAFLQSLQEPPPVHGIALLHYRFGRSNNSGTQKAESAFLTLSRM